MGRAGGASPGAGGAPIRLGWEGGRRGVRGFPDTPCPPPPISEKGKSEGIDPFFSRGGKEGSGTHSLRGW